MSAGALVAGGAVAAVALRRARVAPATPLPADRTYPVRVVWAEPDRVIPFDRFGAPLMERLPGAELIRQPGIGHIPMSDEPGTVARLILDVTGAERRGPIR